MIQIQVIYKILKKAYGNQGWWPLTPDGEVHSKHHQGRPRTDRDRFEICCGAILTQNTNWKNVEKALCALNEKALVDPERMKRQRKEKIAGLIRSAGYFNQKAERLLLLAKQWDGIVGMGEEIDRGGLLGLKGVGPETADSMLLYAFEKPSFVVDAYTRRIFSRIGLVESGAGYDDIKELFEKSLGVGKGSVKLFNEYHALIVEHAKRHCKSKPECVDCPISSLCKKRV